MNKFVSFLTAGALMFSSAVPAIAAAPRSNALSARYNLKVNKQCVGKRALKRAECAHQFNRGLNPTQIKAKQRERACKGKVGMDKAECLKTQRRVWGENRNDPAASSSSSSVSSEGSSSSASSTSSN